MKRLLALALAACALALPTVAEASIDTYYYDNLGANYPVDQCDNNTISFACSGWNYWDRSRVYKYDGGDIAVGFLTTGPLVFYYPASVFCCVRNGSNPILVYRTDVGAPTYNRAACDYASGTASTSLCEAIIF